MSTDKQTKRLQIGLIALENLGMDLLSTPKVTMEQLQDYRTMSDNLLIDSGIAPRRRAKSSLEAADAEEEELDEDLEDLSEDVEAEPADDEIDLDVPESDFLNEDDDEEVAEVTSPAEPEADPEAAAAAAEAEAEAAAAGTEPSTTDVDATTDDDAVPTDGVDVDAGTDDLSIPEEGSDAPAEELEVPEPEAEVDATVGGDDTGGDNGPAIDENLDGGDDLNLDDGSLDGGADDLSGDDDATGAVDDTATQQTPEEIDQELEGQQTVEEAEAAALQAEADQAEAEEEAAVRRELESEIKHVGTVAGKVGSFITKTEDSGLSTDVIREMAELQQSNESLLSYAALDRRLARSTKTNVIAVRKQLAKLR